LSIAELAIAIFEYAVSSGGIFGAGFESLGQYRETHVLDDEFLLMDGY
jgi:hypothetical protein